MATIQNLVGANKIKDEWQKINNNFAALNSAKVEASFLGSFGIGSNVTLRVSTDLNNEMNNGWVAVDPGTTANLPESGVWGVCRTDRRGPTSVYQTVYRIDTANLRIYIRKCNGGTWSGWEQLWHSGNDGAGSGLDADMLNGMKPSTSASANTIVQRDPAGRFKAGAPSASDDVARKAEVDGKVSKSGDTMTGTLTIQGGQLLQKNSRPHHALISTDTNEGVRTEYREDQKRLRWQSTDGNGSFVAQLAYLDCQTGEIYLTPSEYKAYHAGNAGPFYRGSGSPEGVVTAPPGSIYQNTSGGTGTTFYIKRSGTGNTGWFAVA